MAEFDPIANIKRFSPTAHLQKREADTGSALQRLMSGRLIQSDKDIAAGQRQTGVNQAAMERKALELGLPSTLNPGFGDARSRYGEIKRFRDLMTPLAAGRRAGVSPTAIPEGGFRMQDLPSMNYKLGDYPLQAAERLKATFTGQRSASDEIQRYEMDSATGLLQRRTIKEGRKDTAKVQGPNEKKAVEKALEMLKRAQQEWPGQNPQIKQEGNELFVIVGGKQYRLKAP
jgi:hypothetical protein